MYRRFPWINQRVADLIQVAAKCRVVTRFRNTIGLEGRFSSRIQPNHPTDSPRGIAASMFEGLLYGCGDAVIGINPATDFRDAVWNAPDLGLFLSRSVVISVYWPTGMPSRL